MKRQKGFVFESVSAVMWFAVVIYSFSLGYFAAKDDPVHEPTTQVKVM